MHPWQHLAGKKLGPRETQVTALLAEGRTNKEIAHLLKITEGTVKMYVSRVFGKTGLDNRTAVAMWWCQKSNKKLA